LEFGHRVVDFEDNALGAVVAVIFSPSLFNHSPDFFNGLPGPEGTTFSAASRYG
jgi:hypothetical protein